MMVNKKKNARGSQRRPAQAPTPKNISPASIAQSILRALPRGTFAAAGGALAGPKGVAAGSLLSRITGYGDYEVDSNSIHTSGKVGGTVPMFQNSPGKVKIKHREFIGNVYSNGNTFTNTTYTVNPGNSTLFPWLHAVATSYQQWKMDGGVVVFKSTSSDYAVGSALGKVAIGTNYNVSDPPYASMVELENSAFAVASKPSNDQMHPFECASNQRRNDPFYVRTNVTEPGDARFFDMARLQVATEGLTAPVGSIIGELWITYDIEFLKPVLAPPPLLPEYVLLESVSAATSTEGLTAPATSVVPVAYSPPLSSITTFESLGYASSSPIQNLSYTYDFATDPIYPKFIVDYIPDNSVVTITGELNGTGAPTNANMTNTFTGTLVGATYSAFPVTSTTETKVPFIFRLACTTGGRLDLTLDKLFTTAYSTARVDIQVQTLVSR